MDGIWGEHVTTWGVMDLNEKSVLQPHKLLPVFCYVNQRGIILNQL